MNPLVTDTSQSRERDALAKRAGDLNIHAILATRRQIAAVWSIEDVMEIRPDISNSQAWEILQYCRETHDANIGINWDVLSVTAEILFPEKGATS